MGNTLKKSYGHVFIDKDHKEHIEEAVQSHITAVYPHVVPTEQNKVHQQFKTSIDELSWDIPGAKAFAGVSSGAPSGGTAIGSSGPAALGTKICKVPHQLDINKLKYYLTTLPDNDPIKQALLVHIMNNDINSLKSSMYDICRHTNFNPYDYIDKSGSGGSSGSSGGGSGSGSGRGGGAGGRGGSGRGGRGGYGTGSSPAGGYGTGSSPAGGYGTGSPAGGYGTGSPAGGYGTGSPAGGYGTGSPASSYGTGSPAGGYGTGSSSAGGYGTGSPAGGYGTGSSSAGAGWVGGFSPSDPRNPSYAQPSGRRDRRGVRGGRGGRGDRSVPYINPYIANPPTGPNPFARGVYGHSTGRSDDEVLIGGARLTYRNRPIPERQSYRRKYVRGNLTRKNHRPREEE